MTQVVQIKGVKGLQPLLDPRQANDAYLVQGQNVMPRVRGFHSTFGSLLLNFDKLTDPRSVGQFVINGVTYTIIGGTICKYDSVTSNYVVQFVLRSYTETFAPWTVAELDGVYYFAKAGAGLVMHSPATDTWEVLTGNGLETCVATTVSGGRLIALCSDRVAYSTVSDGTDFTPDPAGTGAGFTLLALVGGSPLGIASVPEGFLVFTTDGVAMFENLYDTGIPFRFTAIGGSDDTLVNNQSVTYIGKRKPVFVTKQGLMSYSSYDLVEFSPLMSTYIKEWLSDYNYRTPDVANLVRLAYADDGNYLFLSLNEGFASYEYTKAFVYDTKIEQWGVFNEPHFGLFPVNTVGYTQFSYIGTDGYNHVFDAVNYRQTLNEEAAEYVLNKPRQSGPTYYEGDTIVFVDTVRIAEENTAAFPSSYGLYATDGYVERLESIVDIEEPTMLDEYIDLNALPDEFVDLNALPDEYVDLGNNVIVFTDSFGIANDLLLQIVKQAAFYAEEHVSFADVGPIRLLDLGADSRMWEMQRITVGEASERDEFDYIDLNALPDEYINLQNEPDQFVDLGVIFDAQVTHDMKAYGTYDGSTVDTTNDDTFVLEETDGESRWYSGRATGLYINLRFSTNGMDSSFMPTYIECSGIPAGLRG